MSSPSKFVHDDCELGNGPRFVVAELSGKPLMVDVLPERREGFGVTTIDDLVLPFEERSPEFTHGFA